jgi:hypothetical protein
VAAALERYSQARLIGLARRLDPGLTSEDFAAPDGHHMPDVLVFQPCP